MLFRQLFDETSCTYTYLLATDRGHEAIIIDPVLEKVATYQKLLDELALKLAITLDTHTHADHVTGSGKLSQTQQCSIAMGAHTKAECVHITLNDGDFLRIDGLALKAMYTPGHTDDCYSYVLNDRVFSGDTLLIRGTGRTDFQSGSAHQQYESLFHGLLQLPDDTLVYPAHDYKGMTVSTIYEEKHYNPRLQVNSAEEYAEIMNNLNLPKPKLIDIAVPANLKCGLITTS